MDNTKFSSKKNKNWKESEEELSEISLLPVLCSTTNFLQRVGKSVFTDEFLKIYYE